MKKSAKLDYGCRALLELSLNWPSETPTQVSLIAQNQGIPIKFLVHILIHLKQLGFVKSVRGKSGGYLLAKPPKEIKLSDVIVNFGSGDNSEASSQGESKHKRIMDVIWREVDNTYLKIIDDINFEAICNRERTKGKIPMFEI